MSSHKVRIFFSLNSFIAVSFVILISNPSPELRKIIISEFNIKNLNVVIKGFSRSDVSYTVMKGGGKLEKILNVVYKVNGYGLIFVDSEKDAYSVELKGEDVHTFFEILENINSYL